MLPPYVEIFFNVSFVLCLTSLVIMVTALAVVKLAKVILEIWRD